MAQYDDEYKLILATTNIEWLSLEVRLMLAKELEAEQVRLHNIQKENQHLTNLVIAQNQAARQSVL